MIVANGLRNSWEASPDEPALRSLARFDTGQHVVHRRRQRGDLVPMRGHRNARQIVGADVPATSARMTSTDPNERRTSTNVAAAAPATTNIAAASSSARSFTVEAAAPLAAPTSTV